MQGPEEGVRRSRSRLREGELEERERRGGGEEDSGAQGHAESRFPRDLGAALPGEQQPLHQQDHVPGHRGLAQRSSCKVREEHAREKENARAREGPKRFVRLSTREPHEFLPNDNRDTNPRLPASTRQETSSMIFEKAKGQSSQF